MFLSKINSLNRMKFEVEYIQHGKVADNPFLFRLTVIIRNKELELIS